MRRLPCLFEAEVPSGVVLSLPCSMVYGLGHSFHEQIVMSELTNRSLAGGSLRAGANQKRGLFMTFAKVGFAAVAIAAFIGLSGTASQAAPFSPQTILTQDADLVQVQYRRFGPPRRVCKTEVVRRWVRGRPVLERVERCRTVRR